MEAFAQTIPPRSERELAGLEVPLKFLMELTEIVTPSASSQFRTDQPSSLNPLIASLKPLQERRVNVFTNSTHSFYKHQAEIGYKVANYYM
jgi:hypothetical protein